MQRPNGRTFDELRPITIERHYIGSAAGSVLIGAGDTRVICTASVEDTQPVFLKGTPSGWVTGEYGMLPASTHTRKPRKERRGLVDGRTQEIQRLIGRSMRAVVSLDDLGPRTITLDCDVLQADGGTRTLSVTGAYVALHDAIAGLVKQGVLRQSPLRTAVAAVSVGILREQPLLDLCYEEDFAAEVDMNVVMTGKGEYIEVQGTAEKAAFNDEELQVMLGLARTGISSLLSAQEKALGEA